MTAKRKPSAHATLDQLRQQAAGERVKQREPLLIFGAYTGMRPGELFALEWSDIDFRANRVHVERRLYRGTLDIPKSNKTRTIALPPPARDVLLRQPTRSSELVFLSKTGRRLSQPVLSGYWAQVLARAGLDHDFYLASKHYGVHLLYKLGLSSRAIGAQIGGRRAVRGQGRACCTTLDKPLTEAVQRFRDRLEGRKCRSTPAGPQLESGWCRGWTPKKGRQHVR